MIRDQFPDFILGGRPVAQDGEEPLKQPFVEKTEKPRFILIQRPPDADEVLERGTLEDVHENPLPFVLLREDEYLAAVPKEKLDERAVRVARYRKEFKAPPPGA